MEIVKEYVDPLKVSRGDTIGFEYSLPGSNQRLFSALGVVAEPYNKGRGTLVVRVLHFLTTPPSGYHLNQNLHVLAGDLFACTDKLAALVKPDPNGWLQEGQHLLWCKPVTFGHLVIKVCVVRIQRDEVVVRPEEIRGRSLFSGKLPLGVPVVVPKAQLSLPVV